ncbi:MAG: hypothetical protein ACR5K7_01880 [Symbiopectobacterium sp.]
MTVKGDYVGNSGIIVVQYLAQRGGDTFPTNRLIIDGDNASEHTSLLMKTGNSLRGAY